MDIFVFASSNLTNIWAGIGARLWAVSHSGDSASANSRKTKSQKLKVGSFGLLYCNDTHALTTPFIVYSKPDPVRVVKNVWPEEDGWVLPFKILPLGNPDKQLHKDEAKKVLPIFKNQNVTNFSKVFHVQAVTVFSPSEIGPDDWEILVDRLATEV